MIAARGLPPESLLARYDVPGGYVDCLEARVPLRVDLPTLIEAFYNSRAFRFERWLLGFLLGMKAGPPEVRRLAVGEADKFSAWTVEARTSDQIMLCDFQRRTRSWLMVEAQDGRDTILRFGTAVVRRDVLVFRVLVGFHRLYARCLLAAATRRVMLGSRTSP